MTRTLHLGFWVAPAALILGALLATPVEARTKPMGGVHGHNGIPMMTQGGHRHGGWDNRREQRPEPWQQHDSGRRYHRHSRSWTHGFVLPEIPLPPIPFFGGSHQHNGGGSHNRHGGGSHHSHQR
jgi:hypothetical protein